MIALVIDANNLCHIQLHALGNDLSCEEQATGVLWGFFRQLLLLAERFDTTRFIFAWDSRKSYRHAFYPEYKANRTRFNPEASKEDVIDSKVLFSQIDLLREELLALFGFQNVFHCVGYEADDIIASVVFNWKDRPNPIVVSTDKDLFQLLDSCSIWRPVTREVFLHEDFVNKYGICPEQWVAVRAMSGDPSDNIRGVPGVGEVTALRFVLGTLKLNTATRKSILSETGQGIIERNTKLMKLPFPNTPVFPTDFGQERFMTDDFIKICERYRFLSFLEKNEFNRWRDRFHMVD